MQAMRHHSRRFLPCMPQQLVIAWHLLWVDLQSCQAFQAKQCRTGPVLSISRAGQWGSLGALCNPPVAASHARHADNVEEEGINASLDSGVLTVTVPKTPVPEKPAPKRITVQAGTQ